MSIAQNIIKIVESELLAKNIKQPVKKVVFKYGKLHAIMSDSLSFGFDTIKKDHEFLKDTKLELHEIPLFVECVNCKKEFELDYPLFVCSECSGSVKIKTGEEMIIESVEV